MNECIRKAGLVDNECGSGQHYEPGILKCACGKAVTLYNSITNKCECGKFYNGLGELLSHPRNWGEETGERFNDDGQLVL